MAGYLSGRSRAVGSSTRQALGVLDVSALEINGVRVAHCKGKGSRTEKLEPPGFYS